MLWALIFLEKPQPVGDWGHVMSLDLSPWLWYQFFRAPNSQSGWIKESAINGHSFEMPLLLLWKKKAGIQTVLEHWHCYCLLYWAMATTKTGSCPGQGHLCSEGAVCHVSAKKASDRKVVAGGVCSRVKMQSQREGGGNKNPLCAGGIVKWEDFFPKRFLSL